MKKIIALLLVLVLCVSLMACGGKKSGGKNLESAKLFDIFRGEKLGAGQKCIEQDTHNAHHRAVAAAHPGLLRVLIIPHEKAGE